MAYAKQLNIKNGITKDDYADFIYSILGGNTQLKMLAT